MTHAWVRGNEASCRSQYIAGVTRTEVANHLSGFCGGHKACPQGADGNPNCKPGPRQTAPAERGGGPFSLVLRGGQGRDRTGDLPLFRSRVIGSRAATRDKTAVHSRVVYEGGPRQTPMNETQTEHLPAAYVRTFRVGLAATGSTRAYLQVSHLARFRRR